MLSVLIRYALDAFYVLFFFTIMSGLAYVAHFFVELATRNKLDSYVILILRMLEYFLVTIDGFGVAIAGIFLTWRFIVELIRADANAA